MATIVLTRSEKGAKIAVQDVEKINPSTYFVKSQSGKSGYSVTKFHGVWSCDCADHKFRGVQCKHILAVKAQQNQKCEYFEECGNSQSYYCLHKSKAVECGTHKRKSENGKLSPPETCVAEGQFKLNLWRRRHEG